MSLIYNGIDSGQAKRLSDGVESQMRAKSACLRQFDRFNRAERGKIKSSVCAVAKMKLAARMAVHALPCDLTGEKACQTGPSVTGANPSGGPGNRANFHGSNVTLCELSPSGFVANVDERYPRGAVVRLRLPGAGMILARVIGERAGRLRAEFVNPVSPARLSMALGMT
jgi:hypothetical protein